MNQLIQIITVSTLLCVTATFPVAAQEAQSPATVLMVKGVWWNHFRAEEALGEMGHARWASTWHASGRSGGSLRWFDPNPAALNRFDLMMVLNVPFDAMGASGSMAVADYIRRGGGMFLFGGPYLFPGKPERHRALLDLLPVVPSKTNARTHLQNGGVLTPTEAGQAFFKGLKFDWGKTPRLFYYNPVEVQEEATVLLTCGGAPILITREVEGGRVALFAASVEGEEQVAQLAFWDWQDFPRLLARVNDWLRHGKGSDKRLAIVSPKAAAAIKELPEMDLELQDLTDEQGLKRIAAALPYCDNPTTAKAILEAVSFVRLSEENTFSLEVTDALLPYCHETWGATALDLSRKRTPANVAVGLQLLGALHHDEASSLLSLALANGAKFLTMNKAENTGFDQLGGGDGLSFMRVSGADELIRLSAVIGLGLLGNPEDLPALKNMRYRRQEFADTNIKNFYDEEIYQECLIARLRLGDLEAVTPFTEVLLKNDRDIRIAYQYIDDMILYARKSDRAFMNNHSIAKKRIPELRARREKRLYAMSTLPPAMRKAILKAGSSWPVVPPYAEILSWAMLPYAQTDDAWLTDLSQNTGFPSLQHYANRGKREHALNP